MVTVANSYVEKKRNREGESNIVNENACLMIQAIATALRVILGHFSF